MVKNDLQIIGGIIILNSIIFVMFANEILENIWFLA